MAIWADGWCEWVAAPKLAPADRPITVVSRTAPCHNPTWDPDGNNTHDPFSPLVDGSGSAANLSILLL